MPPIAIVSTRNKYVTWRITKDIPLLTPEQNDAVAVGPTVPWSWSLYRNTLTYWDDKGREFDIEGDEQETGDAHEAEMCDGAEWGYESDTHYEDEEPKCEKCDYKGDSVVVHPHGCVALCEDCSVDEKGEPQCPRDQPFTRDEACDWCIDHWQKNDEKAEISKKYSVRMTYADFRKNMVETDEGGPWGDNHFYQTFDKYVDDGLIEIEYKYGPCVNWKTEIIWRIPETEKTYKLRYGHSSPFAMWWCGLTDEIEEEAEWNSSDEDKEDLE